MDDRYRRHRAAVNRRRKRNRRVAGIAVMAVALIIAFFSDIHKPDIVLDAVEIEAGKESPSPDIFLKKDGYKLEYEDPEEVAYISGIPGDHEVKLRNRLRVYESVLSVKDTQPPVISGAKDITIPVGDGVSYLSGVGVADNALAEPELEVDTSAVKIDAVGSYPVVYKAYDASGNSSSVTVTLTVRDKTREEKSKERLDELADSALLSCVKDGMTDYEKLWSIFCYISEHISYVDDAETMDETEEGINGFIKGTGSCFTYFASMKAMLERAGFDTINVTRDKTVKEGQHFWSLVKYEGEWYHIDATPRGPEDGREYLIFLLTDEQISAMNAAYGNYWAYDKTEYPGSGAVSPYRGEPLPSMDN